MPPASCSPRRGETATDDPVVEMFLTSAIRHASLNRKEEARELLTSLRRLLSGRMKTEVAQRIALLEAQVESGQLPRPEPASETVDRDEAAGGGA